MKAADAIEPTVAVVDCGPGDRGRLARLEAALPTRVSEGAPTEPEEVVERAKGATVLTTLYTYTAISEEVLDRLPRLKLVATRTAGHSHIDLASARRLGITVAAVPSAPTIAVAEYTLAAMLALNRRLIAAVSSTRARNWDFTDFRGRDLSGQTLGVVGLGAIGTRVAHLGQALGMRAMGWSRRPKAIPGVEQLSLDDVVARADAVSVNVALTSDTDGLLNADRLRRMRPGACLVNTARGEILDLDALCDLLRRGHLRGACVDVVRDEPVSSERLAKLASVPNLLVTPHVSWHTEETLDRQFAGMTDTIIAFCEGRAIQAVTVGVEP